MKTSNKIKEKKNKLKKIKMKGSSLNNLFFLRLHTTMLGKRREIVQY